MQVVGYFVENVWLKVTFPANISAPLNKPTTLPLQVLTNRNFMASFFINEKQLYVQKLVSGVFEPPFGGLEGKVRASSTTTKIYKSAISRIKTRIRVLRWH